MNWIDIIGPPLFALVLIIFAVGIVMIVKVVRGDSK